MVCWGVGYGDEPRCSLAKEGEEPRFVVPCEKDLVPEFYIGWDRRRVRRVWRMCYVQGLDGSRGDIRYSGMFTYRLLVPRIANHHA